MDDENVRIYYRDFTHPFIAMRIQVNFMEKYKLFQVN